jgi:hypothetical protein
MNGLAGLVVPTIDSLGYPSGWGKVVADRLREGFPEGSEGLTVVSGLLEEVDRCEGFWWGRTQVELPPSRVSEIRGQFIRTVALRYLEASIAGQADRPLDFLASYMVEEANFDPLTATWLFLMPSDARHELAREVATAISALVAQWPEVLDGSRVTVGPVVGELSLGPVVLAADVVDVTFGDHRLGVEVNWPGSVLVSLKTGVVSPRDIDDMAVDVLLHTIATGCPPHRLVTYGLMSGRGYAIDVEPSWLEMAIGRVLSTVKSVVKVQATESLAVSPGDHCVVCPLRGECDASEADEYPF